MKVQLKLEQRFIIPLKNEYSTYLLVKEIDFLGMNEVNHNILQTCYTGTKIIIDLETEELSKEEDYTVIMDEEINVEYSKGD